MAANRSGRPLLRDRPTVLGPNRSGPLPPVTWHETGTRDVRHNPSPRVPRVSRNGRYWARTSDPQLVELVLSQLS
jgi:hypothetical protein